MLMRVGYLLFQVSIACRVIVCAAEKGSTVEQRIVDALLLSATMFVAAKCYQIWKENNNEG